MVRERKALGSCSKKEAADRVTVTILIHCRYLMSHQAAFLYCFGVFLDSLSLKELEGWCTQLRYICL